MRRWTALAMVLAMVAAACGSSSGEDSDTTTTAAAPTPTSTVAPASTTTSTVASTTTTTITLPPDPNIGSNSDVTTVGLGPVRVGMTPQEANAAAGFALAVEQLPGESCYFLTAAPVLPGVAFMVNLGTIARVDVTGGPVTTRSGAGIGNTENEIKSLFGAKIQEEPHAFTAGKYLTFVPADDADSNFRVVFETTQSGVVDRYRAGRLPEVGWVEGCS